MTWTERGVARPRLLLIVPYGMALRNLVLNETLWSYLTRRFVLHLLTPISVDDPGALGLSSVDRPSDATRLTRLVQRARAGATAILMSLDRVGFFMECGEAESLRSVHRYARIEGHLSRLLFWSWIGQTRFGPFVRALARRIARLDVGVVRVRSFDVVMLTHNAEPLSMAYGIAANCRRIPVICMPMGLDNLMHGPLTFVPDLLLSWGAEQDRDLRSQVAFNRDVGLTSSRRVGSTIHDAYLASGRGLDVDRIYDLRPDDQLIVFSAYVERYGDSQLPVCRLLLDVIHRGGGPAKLLVRTRPGFDESLWKDFQAANPTDVRLQMPRAASYDKSGRVSRFELAAEREEVSLFAATLRRCSLLVTPTFSTTEMDAMLFGKPAISAIFDPAHPDAVHPLLGWFQAGRAKTPEWRGMRVVTTREELTRAVVDALAGRAPLDDDGERLFRYRATARDGHAGDRAVEGIESFMRDRSLRGGS